MKFFDDDMDELFNKAGSQYPLKTEPNNWEAGRGALHQEEGVTGAAKNNKSWRRVLVLLLLLLIPAVYIFLDKDNISDKTIISSENNNQKTLTNSLTDKNGNSDTKQPVKALQPLVTIKQTPNTNKIGDPGKIPFVNAPIAKQSSANKNNVDETKAVNLKEVVTVNLKAASEQRNTYRIPMLTPSTDINDGPAAWNSIPSLNTGFNELNEPSEVISLNAPVRSLNQSNGSQSVPNSSKKIKNRKGIYYG